MIPPDWSFLDSVLARMLQSIEIALIGTTIGSLLAVFPQVLPEFVATSLYRFEINLRAATVLGMVGVGGIGVILDQALKYRRWSVVGMALITVVIAVTVIDYSSAFVRKKIIQGD